MRIGDRNFKRVWLMDFEFFQPPGERPTPLCYVARELVSGRTDKVWIENAGGGQASPMAPIGPDELLVAYLASAEMSCLLAMGIDLPLNVLDLYTEFKNTVNGDKSVTRHGLFDALRYFGGDVGGRFDKETMRDLAKRGGPYSEAEKGDLLSYCEKDVDALETIFHKILPSVDTERALLRGRYMRAVSKIEFAGIPIDTCGLRILNENWTGIKGRLVETIGQKYGVFVDGKFNIALFSKLIEKKGVEWPLTPTSRPKTDRDTFREMARRYPEFGDLKELLTLLGQLKLVKLRIGTDGRNRYMTGVFRSKTGRNQPSNSQCIYGPARWIRHLIKPTEGKGLAYIDYEQQEFGIAAALSDDEAMKSAYLTGDAYMAFAIQAGAVPEGATKKTHPLERTQYKATALGVQYGMGAKSLSKRLGCPEADALDFLRRHRRTYRTFWAWIEDLQNRAYMGGFIRSVFGWRMRVDRTTSDRTLLNFPMQANGAEMLRLSAIFSTERGVRVAGMIHDALLIESPLAELASDIETVRNAMKEASKIVLGGFEIRTDAKKVEFPERYRSEGGGEMWNRIWEIVGELGAETPEGILV